LTIQSCQASRSRINPTACWDGRGRSRSLLAGSRSRGRSLLAGGRSRSRSLLAGNGGLLGGSGRGSHLAGAAGAGACLLGAGAGAGAGACLLGTGACSVGAAGGRLLAGAAGSEPACWSDRHRSLLARSLTALGGGRRHEAEASRGDERRLKKRIDMRRFSLIHKGKNLAPTRLSVISGRSPGGYWRKYNPPPWAVQSKLKKEMIK